MTFRGLSAVGHCKNIAAPLCERQSRERRGSNRLGYLLVTSAPTSLSRVQEKVCLHKKPRPIKAVAYITILIFQQQNKAKVPKSNLRRKLGPTFTLIPVKSTVLQLIAIFKCIEVYLYTILSFLTSETVKSN